MRFFVGMYNMYCTRGISSEQFDGSIIHLQPGKCSARNNSVISCFTYDFESMTALADLILHFLLHTRKIL